MTNETNPVLIASAALATAHRSYNRARSPKTTTRAQATRAAISAVRAYRRARAAYNAVGPHPLVSNWRAMTRTAYESAYCYAGAAIMAARVIHPKTA